MGLVLGGGGSRGIAHIGVLEVLQREQIPIDLIVGTSMGAIVGALFARGISPDAMLENLRGMRGSNLFTMNWFSAGARQRMVADRLAEGLSDQTFADLKIPLIVMAVDMLHGQEIALQSGPLIPALLASSAVPAVFPPVEIDGMQLLDGGVIDSLATHVAYEQNVQKIIAVDVYPPLEKDDPWIDPLSAIMGFQLPFNILSNGTTRPPSMLSSIWRAFRVMAWHVHEERLAAHPPHILLRPEVHNYGSLDFKDVDGPYQAGVTAAEQHLAEIKALTSERPTE